MHRPNREHPAAGPRVARSIVQYNFTPPVTACRFRLALALYFRYDGSMQPQRGELSSFSMNKQVPVTLFDIKRFALHDGPGIRTSVFFKGCSLTCAWCHNPESQSTEPQLMHNANLCVNCEACLPACSHGAIRHGSAVPVTDRSLCTACGACAAACPYEARQVSGYTSPVAEVMDVLTLDRPFYEESGGGVTLSGGEPLHQPDAVLALLETCKRQGMHTALDTCGYAPKTIIKQVAPLVDLFLYDLKLMDNQDHLDATGVPNQEILENLRVLDHLGARIWLRLPLIPGVNDAPDQLEAVADFASNLNHLEALHLLPYHRSGVGKAKQLGRCPAFDATPRLHDDLATFPNAIGSRIDVPVLLGGNA